MIFDEGYVGGAAAEGFDAYGASAGEDVEEARAYYAGAEDVEERFTKAVAGGTEGEAFRGSSGCGCDICRPVSFR